ncbi:MAG: hypothetical protein ACTSSE_10045 [Candidatus Thorarchaeota archaeon]
MAKNKINPLFLIAFTLSGILLLMVQFGVISPNGLIEITSSQYTLVFWFSLVFFIISTANLVARIPTHAQWSTGYRGTISRTVKISGKQKDYFIHGAGDTPIKKVLLENWPFEEEDPDSNWHVVDEHGNDVTNALLSSLDEIATVIIEEDTR